MHVTCHAFQRDVNRGASHSAHKQTSRNALVSTTMRPIRQFRSTSHHGQLIFLLKMIAIMKYEIYTVCALPMPPLGGKSRTFFALIAAVRRQSSHHQFPHTHTHTHKHAKISQITKQKLTKF